MGILINYVVDYFIISLLVAHYLKMDHKKKFVVITTVLLSIFSYVFDSLSIFMIALLLCLVLCSFYKKMNNTILITSFLASTIPYISQTFATLIISLALSVDAQYASGLVICATLSKVFMIVVGIGIIYIKEKLTLLNQLDDWWVLSLIFIDIISILYILMDMIVYQQINIEIMYLLIVLILILAALFMALLFLILRHNEELLVLEKTKLEVQNIQTIRSMYDTVLSTKHFIYYTLKKIQLLTKNYANQELENVLEESLSKTQQMRNVIYTGNPYFDYSFNEILSTRSIITDNLKLMVLVKEEPILNNKEYVDVLLRLFCLFYESSSKHDLFELAMSNKQGNLFLSMTGKIDEHAIIDENLDRVLKQYQTTYHIHEKDNTFTFKAITLL